MYIMMSGINNHISPYSHKLFGRSWNEKNPLNSAGCSSAGTGSSAAPWPGHRVADDPQGAFREHWDSTAQRRGVAGDGLGMGG